MVTAVPDFSSSKEMGSERLFLGLSLALLMHLGLVLLFIPNTEPSALAGPMRITVQMTQNPIIEEPEVVEPKQEKTKLSELTKQLLTAKNDTPPEPDDFFVLEQPPETEVVKELVPVVSVEIEPKKEEVKQVEPKKQEQPKPKKVIKKPEKKPDVIPKIVDVVEAVTATPIEAAPSTEKIEDVNTEISAVASSTGQSSNGSPTSTTLNATGTNQNGDGGGGSDEVERNKAWKGYGQLLYAMVSKNKSYPQLAIRRHLEGTVMVSISFVQGKVVDMKIVGQGSGYSVLDKAAREMIDKAVKKLPVRGELLRKSFTVVVPVNFSLVN